MDPAPRSRSSQIAPQDGLIFEAAKAFGRLGLPVIPIRAGTKIPLTQAGVYDASCDKGQIDRWWQRWPHAELALACGAEAGFDALDVDMQHGGPEELERLRLEAATELPKTVRQQTPSGGFHLLFRHRPKLKNRSGGKGLVPPGLDCRTTGAMIKVAPSPGYHWDIPLSVGDLASWPDWLATYFVEREGPGLPKRYRAALASEDDDRSARYLEAALVGICQEIVDAEPGSQNSTLNAGSFRMGILLAAHPHRSVSQALDPLVDAGLAMQNEMGRRPWSRAEIERIVRAGLNAGLAKGTGD